MKYYALKMRCLNSRDEMPTHLHNLNICKILELNIKNKITK